MMTQIQHREMQAGFMMLEALVAILIFAFGVLGLVALSSQAISAQSDAEYRTVAANLANEMASTIALGADRCPSCTVASDVATHITASLAAYAHQSGGAVCAFTGTQSTNADVLSWVTKVTTPTSGLPGASAAGLQISTNNPNNGVVITVCWKAPKDIAQRHFTLVTYVN
jgi:type IV pilus assembly protein PilV